MKCEVCHQGPCDPSGPSIYRVSEYGKVPARWRCGEHLTGVQEAAIDQQVLDIVNIIENGTRKNN